MDETEEVIKEYTKNVVLNTDELTKTINWLIPLSNNEENFAKTLDASFNIVPSTNNLNVKENSNTVFNRKFNGIFTRPIERMKFTIEPLGFPIKLENDNQHFFEYLPSQSRLMQIPINRALFAKKIQNLNFNEGILTQNKIACPSEIEGFISIPLNIIKAIVSIPSQLLQFKINNTKKESELKTEIQNLQKIISEGERNKASNQLVKDELELDVKKNLLESQKAIIELKQQIQRNNTSKAIKDNQDFIELQKKMAKLKKQMDELKSN